MAEGTQTPRLQIPQVEPDLEGVRELVRWAANAPLRRRWSGDQLRGSYCTRSPLTILSEGELAFTAPCADLSSLTALALQQHGLQPTLVLTGIKRALQTVKFQCGLELLLEGRTWVIGFGVSSTYFYEGQFLPTKRRPLVLRREQPLDPERPFVAWFLEGGREDVSQLVPGYDLETDLRFHRMRQSRLLFALARRRARDVDRSRRLGRLDRAAGRWA